MLIAVGDSAPEARPPPMNRGVPMLRPSSRWKLAYLLTTSMLLWGACTDDDSSSGSTPPTPADISSDAAADAALDAASVLDAAPSLDAIPDVVEDTAPEVSAVDATGINPDSSSLEDASGDIPSDLLSPTDATPGELPEDTAVEPGPITVLFIGNSYTFGNQLPDLVQEWAQEIGLDLSTEMIAKGGALLEQHAADAQTLATIAEMAPTYVVLQGQSYVPLVAPFTFYTGVAPLAQAAHAAGSTPVLFETWARQEGHAMYSNELAGHDPASMQQTLREAYKKAAADNDGIYAPVGDAWEVSLGANPELTLHSGDGSHAAMAGSYLAAAVFVGLLGDVEINADTSSWTAKSVDESDGALLREAAQQALNAP
jgi:hypothetical protein